MYLLKRAPFLPFSYYIGLKPIFLIADTDMVKEITVKQFSNFMNNLVKNDYAIKCVYVSCFLFQRRAKLAAQYAPEGLLLAQGEDWRVKKKVVTRVFSVVRIKQVSYFDPGY